jgi:hypothetical protein
MNPDKKIRALVLFTENANTALFSYQEGWPRAFAKSSWFSCQLINVADQTRRQRLARKLFHLRRSYDIVVILHSVFSNSCFLTGSLFEAIAGIRAPKAYFLSNEYKLMPEKMSFCDALGVKLVVSISNADEVLRRYRERLGCEVMFLPVGGLDRERFHPGPALENRPIDIGYRSTRDPIYFGHGESETIARHFVDNASQFGVTVDASLEDEDRLPVGDWADFLRRCKAQIGIERGSDYFDLCDEPRKAVIQFLLDHEGPSADDVRREVLVHYSPCPIRVISGRHIEAAGTKTLQILFDGEYCGLFEPDVHYIALSKDFSNIDDVMRKFRDPGFRERIVENAYDLATSRLTYEKLIGQFHDAVVGVL